MARSIEQIQAELASAYQPQIDLVNQQVAALPQYYEAQTQGLNVAKEQAFRDITGQASARGLAYSGMPIAEQTRYTGTKYLPALAALQQQQAQQRFSLQNTLNQIATQRLNQAQSIRQTELNREEQARQAELNRQAQLQAARARSYGGGGGGGGGSRSISSADRIGAATQDALNALQYAKANPGKVQDYYRENVASQLMATYGISPQQAGGIIGQVMPAGWEWRAGIRR